MSQIKSVKELFEKNLNPNLKIDKEFFEKLKIFRVSWSQRTEDHIEFLGSNYIGLQPVRFSSQDEDIFFSDIVEIDKDTLITDIKYTKGIDTKRKVESNPYYLTTVYLMHRFTTSSLPNNLKIEAVTELYYLFAYKVISSLIMHYFKYNADISLIKATDSRLSNKFLIKRVNSWQELFTYRARDVLPSGLHYSRLKSFSTEDCLRVIRDMQGRIRDIVKNIYAVMLEVKESNEKVVSSSLLMADEEGVKVGDITNSQDRYIIELNRLLSLERDLIDNDLLYLLSNVLKTFNVNETITILQYITNNDFSGKDVLAEHIITDGVDILQRKNIKDYQKNILVVIQTIKNWFINRSISNNLKKTKDDVNKVVCLATKQKPGWRSMNSTVSVMIYLFVRAIIKKEI